MNIYKDFGIYRITNIQNGNSYVGKTGMNFGDRWDCHKAQLNGGYHDNPHLQNAWNKYGYENFEFCVIEVVDDVSKLNDLEKEYISKYKSVGKSYNILEGGDGGFLLGSHLSEEAKKRISEKNRVNMIGKKASRETKAKMSASQRKRYEAWSSEDRAAFGKKMSEASRGYKWSNESRLKFSERQKTKPNGSHLNIDVVREIRRLHEEEHKTFTEISKELNINRQTVYNIATYRRWANA